MYKTAAVLLAVLVSVTTGCASMGTKRPSGGAQIQKQAPAESATPSYESPMADRAELGQR